MITRLTRKVEAPTATCTITIYIDGDTVAASPAPTITNVTGTPTDAAVAQATATAALFVGMTTNRALSLGMVIDAGWKYALNPVSKTPTADDIALSRMLAAGWVQS